MMYIAVSVVMSFLRDSIKMFQQYCAAPFRQRRSEEPITVLHKHLLSAIFRNAADMPDTAEHQKR